MKKLVLIMVFVLLMALFIAFNYLLWDRESMSDTLKSLELTNASNSANMNTQNREIKRLENEINQYITDISKLEKEKEQFTQRNLQLESDKTAEAQKTRHKIEIINILKQNANMELFETPVKKWVEAINTGDYGEAYRLEYENASLQNQQETLEEYTNNLKSNVKSINIKEIILDKDAGKADGEISIDVTIEVKLTEKPESTFVRFTEGSSKMNLELDYDVTLNEFVIIAIEK